MSIFSTAIQVLATADVQELLDEKAVENVRLEFKRDVPGKDETLKKLSSFANTFGGYLVVGAEAGNDGRITGLPGVAPERGYKQTIIQWCTGGATPPLTAEVSDPIPAPRADGRVCYVINVRESELAPHFLNGRKGLYVRTDEFSSRFEPRLATEYELRYLLDRRRLIREHRTALLQRARERFQTFSRQQATEDLQGSKPLPAFLVLTLVPQYPARPVVDHEGLLSLLRRTSVSWRHVGFPQDLSLISQHESAIALRPCNRWSLLEANIWGMLSYATGIGEEREQFRGIHTPQFLGYILVFLKHAARIMRDLGLMTSVHVEVLLHGVRGIPWVHFPSGFPAHGPCSVLDDTVSFSLTATTETLMQSRDQFAMDLLRLVFFAMNWPGTADDPAKLAALVRWGNEYNGW
jgi:Putative DNA-binding domain